MRAVRTACCLAIVACCATGAAFGQGAVCPLQPGETLCAQLQGVQCQTTVPNQTCRPKAIIVDPALPGGIRVIQCECFSTSACGPVTINGNIASCTGFCPVPPQGNTCQIFINGAPSGQTSVNYTTLQPGSQILCECAPTGVTVCAPTAVGNVCTDVTCPNSAHECLPTCILVDTQGLVHVQDCTCRSPNACHAEAVAGAPPQCVGGCPPGYTCFQRVTPTPTGTEYCCECVQDPPFCEPTTDGSACTNYLCPGPVPPIDTCRPRCVRWNPPTGQYQILECDCRGQNECHVEFTPGTVPFCNGGCPPGQNCTRNFIENADGTITICCDCIQQECECPGDVDGNGVLNALDIAGFVRCFLGNPLPSDNCACVDINGDGQYTVVDVNLFVGLILTKSVCPNTPCCPKMDLVQSLATGTNNGLIPVGNDDDEWVVTLDASGGSVPRPATVVTPHSSWATFPGTQWISANYFGPNGDYEYQFCFCLDDRYTSAVLSFACRADDAGQVFLNGNLLGSCAAFSDPNPPTLSTSNPAFFHAGQNCVTVRVENIGGPPTGLNMIGTVNARNGKCCCPPKRLVKTPDSGVYDNSGGTLIPFGNNDDTWTVIAPDPSGGSTPRPATVITPNVAWGVIPGTRWVSAAQYGPNGTYHYQYCFCLDPRFKNPTLVIDLLADDRARVFLNGNPIGATPLSYAFLNPPTHIVVTNPTLFEACENCIEIEVDNTHGVVTGFDIKVSLTADDGLCCDDRPLACCLPDGNCLDLAPGVTQCPNGVGTVVDGPCGNSLACCLPGGDCQMLSPVCCALLGGTALPAGQACSGLRVACCLPIVGGTTCIIADELCCSLVLGGIPQPAYTSCVDANGNAQPDACEPQVCPLNASVGSQLCAARQGSDCPSTIPTNNTCHPTVVIKGGIGQGFTIEHCACKTTASPCGLIDIQPAGTPGDYLLRCLGACGAQSGCSIYLNGSPAGVSVVNTANLLPGVTVTCGCFIP